MSSMLSPSFKRAYAAFVVGCARHQNGSLSSIRLFSSFQAPEPPESKGHHVYNDIQFSVGSDSSSFSVSKQRNSDPEAVFVINGASRGIGVQFVKTLVERTKGNIVACCRSPSDAEDLQQVITSLSNTKDEGRIKTVELDLEDQDSIVRAGTEIATMYNKRVDVLLNVAGILGDGKSTPGPERSVSKIEREWMEKSFSVNVIGPVMFSKEITPLMAQSKRGSKKKQEGESSGRPKNAVVANLSARVGSISDNGLGGWYSYRMSKSALNQATRTLAHELKRQSIWCVSLHPGTTDTDLSKPFQGNVQEGRLFPVEFTVDKLLNVIDSMDEENSGGLYDWAGKAIPF